MAACEGDIKKRDTRDKYKGKNCVKTGNGIAEGSTDVKFSMHGIMMMILALTWLHPQCKYQHYTKIIKDSMF
jgi:hypothetical protein